MKAVEITITPRATGGYVVRFWIDDESYVQHFASSLRRVDELSGMYS